MSSKLLVTELPLSRPDLLPEARPLDAPRRIPVYQPDLNGREREYVLDCLDTNWISSRGSYITRFEKAFGEFIGQEHCTGICNGTAAIEVALAALGVGPGDEVIVPSFTYIASVNTIVAVGATPVFAEIDASTWQLDAEAITALITPRTKAIMAVHLYGNACDMERICAIAKGHGLLVIEDCAESFGTTVRGRHTGTFGDIATFSFFGNKTITTGEGGMVTCRDAKLMERAFSYKTQGVSQKRTYWHDSIGFNYRMTNIEAAIGLAQIERAESFIARKRALAARYERTLRGLPLDFAKSLPGVENSHWMVSITLRESAHRDPLRAHLETRGIETRPFFHPAHQLPMYKAPGLEFAKSDQVSAAGMNLPSWPGIPPDDVDTICKAIKSYFR